MKIPQETVARIKSVQMLIELKELEVAALKNHMATLIRDAVGIDTNAGAWELDLDANELHEVVV